MSDLALASVLAITILLASTISIEIGLSVALIALAAGVAVGNAFTIFQLITGLPCSSHSRTMRSFFSTWFNAIVLIQP